MPKFSNRTMYYVLIVCGTACWLPFGSPAAMAELNSPAAAQLSYAQALASNYLYSSAIDSYKRIISQYSASDSAFEAQKGLAALYIEDGNFDTAEQCVDTLIVTYAQNPNLATSVYELASKNWDKFNFAQAQRLYQSASDNASDSTLRLKARVLVAGCDIRLSDYSAARAKIASLVIDCNTNPGLPEQIFELGCEFRYMARYADAADLFNLCINSWDFTRAKGGLIANKINMGDYTGAAESVELLLNNSPTADILEALYDVANEYWSAHKYTKAAILYRYIEANSRDTEQALLAAEATINSDIRSEDYSKIEQNIAQLKDKYAGNPKLPQALVNLAGVCRDYSQYDKAEQIYTSVITGYPQSGVEMNARIGLITIAVETKNAALVQERSKVLKDSYGSNSQSAAGMYDLANYFWDREDYQGAKQWFAYIAGNYPASVYALRSEIWQIGADIRMGNYDNASGIDSIVSKYSGDARLPQNLSNLAKEYRLKGQYEKARTLYEGVVGSWPWPNTENAKNAVLGYSNLASSSIEDSNTVLQIPQAIATDPLFLRSLFWRAEQDFKTGLEKRSQYPDPRNTHFLASVTIIENYILGKTSTKEATASAYYMIGLNYRELGEYLKAADAFTNAIEIETDPNHEYAGNMPWLWLLIADCFEKLKVEGNVDASEADIVIETAYQNVVTNYTNGGNLEYALMRLGKINMEKHKYATACAYFQRLLVVADGNYPGIADVNSIVERYRSATDE